MAIRKAMTKQERAKRDRLTRNRVKALMGASKRSIKPLPSGRMIVLDSHHCEHREQEDGLLGEMTLQITFRYSEHTAHEAQRLLAVYQDIWEQAFRDEHPNKLPYVSDHKIGTAGRLAGWAKLMRRTVAETQAMWEEENPHFKGEMPHRYDDDSIYPNECVYCGCPKDYKRT